GAPGTAPDVRPMRRFPAAMATRPFPRRILVVVMVLGAIPPALLASPAVYLTQRIPPRVEAASPTHHPHGGQQVAEAFEVELMAHLRRGLAPVESAIHQGMDARAALISAPMAGDGFAGAHYVPVEELNGFSMLLVESQPLAYAPGDGRRRNQ